MDKLKDKRLSRTLAEGAYVAAEDLVNPDTDGLGAVLPAGMRAVAIRVQPDALAGGHVLPKSHVDVLCTVRGNEGSTTYTILENMEVLAVDLKSGRTPDDAPAMLGNTVTLAATPEDCNLLKMAAGNGELNLVLRGIGDDKSTKPKSINQKALQNPHQFRDASGDSDPVVAGSGGTQIPVLPPVDPGVVPQPPVTLPNVEPVKKEPELEVFIMTIMTGTNVEKVRFVRKPGDPWSAVGSDPANPASPPEKKPDDKPTAPPSTGVRQRDQLVTRPRYSSLSAWERGDGDARCHRVARSWADQPQWDGRGGTSPRPWTRTFSPAGGLAPASPIR